MWDVNVTGDSSLVLAQTLVYAQVGADRVCEDIPLFSCFRCDSACGGEGCKGPEAVHCVDCASGYKLDKEEGEEAAKGADSLASIRAYALILQFSI